MKDWRDYFNERMARKIKIEQAHIARGDGHPKRVDFDYESLKYLIEACRDEAYVSAGGRPSDINLGPNHPAIKAVRAVKTADILADAEKMHYREAALATLPPGLFAKPSDWTVVDKIRFVRGAPQVFQ